MIAAGGSRHPLSKMSIMLSGQHQPRPKAEAKRTLEGVACMPWFGLADGGRQNLPYVSWWIALRRAVKARLRGVSIAW
jgi:hypothetical protein